MRTIAFCILIFSLSCINDPKISIKEFAYKAYFNANLSYSFEELLNQYFAQPNLKFTKPEDGFTLYPPLSGVIDTNIKYIFSFIHHPYIKTLDKEGELIIHRIRGGVSELELSYLFKSHQNAIEFIQGFSNNIKEKPIMDSTFQDGKSLRIHYSNNNGDTLKVDLNPVKPPGYRLIIRFKQKELHAHNIGLPLAWFLI